MNIKCEQMEMGRLMRRIANAAKGYAATINSLLIIQIIEDNNYVLLRIFRLADFVIL